jgi:hypothetical protein
MGWRSRLAAAFAGLTLVVGMGGCGGSSAAPAISGTTLAAICTQTAVLLGAIEHRRIVRRGGNDVIVVPSKDASERQQAVKQALSEDAAVYAAAIPAVERLQPATSAGGVALAHLEETSHRITTLREELAKRSEDRLGILFDVGEASGGCRKLRTAIGG